jgi:hypothetical protein
LKHVPEFFFAESFLRPFEGKSNDSDGIHDKQGTFQNDGTNVKSVELKRDKQLPLYG